MKPKIETELTKKNLSFAINQITNRLLIINPTEITEYNLNTNLQNWSYSYTHFIKKWTKSEPWITQTALIEPMSNIDSWCLILNKRYFFIIYNNLCFSYPIDLESKLSSVKFLNRTSEIFCLKEDLKQFKIWLLDVPETALQIRKFKTSLDEFKKNKLMMGSKWFRLHFDVKEHFEIDCFTAKLQITKVSPIKKVHILDYCVLEEARFFIFLTSDSKLLKVDHPSGKTVKQMPLKNIDILQSRLDIYQELVVIYDTNRLMIFDLCLEKINFTKDFSQFPLVEQPKFLKIHSQGFLNSSSVVTITENFDIMHLDLKSGKFSDIQVEKEKHSIPLIHQMAKKMRFFSEKKKKRKKVKLDSEELSEIVEQKIRSRQKEFEVIRSDFFVDENCQSKLVVLIGMELKLINVYTRLDQMLMKGINKKQLGQLKFEELKGLNIFKNYQGDKEKIINEVYKRLDDNGGEKQKFFYFEDTGIIDPTYTRSHYFNFVQKKASNLVINEKFQFLDFDRLVKERSKINVKSGMKNLRNHDDDFEDEVPWDGDLSTKIETFAKILDDEIRIFLIKFVPQFHLVITLTERKVHIINLKITKKDTNFLKIPCDEIQFGLRNEYKDNSKTFDFILYNGHNIQLLEYNIEANCLETKDLYSFPPAERSLKILYNKNFFTLVQENGIVSYRKIPSLAEIKNFRFPCEHITTAEVIGTSDFYIANDRFDVQNVEVRGQDLLKKKNEIFIFHKFKVIGIKVKSREDLDECYLFSLDESSLIAVWNTKRSKLGPLFVLNFKEKIQKIVGINGLFRTHFKSFSLVLKSKNGIFRSAEGDLTPYYAFIYKQDIQEKWYAVQQRWVKNFSALKGKKNPITTNSEFINFVIKSLTKRKLIKNLKVGTKGVPIPLFYKRYYGFENMSFFTSSHFADVYLALTNCFLKAYYGITMAKVIDQFYGKIMKKDVAEKEEQFKIEEVHKKVKFNLLRPVKKRKIRSRSNARLMLMKELEPMNKNKKVERSSSVPREIPKKYTMKHPKLVSIRNKISKDFKRMETSLNESRLKSDKADRSSLASKKTLAQLLQHRKSRRIHELDLKDIEKYKKKARKVQTVMTSLTPKNAFRSPNLGTSSKVKRPVLKHSKTLNLSKFYYAGSSNLGPKSGFYRIDTFNHKDRSEDFVEEKVKVTDFSKIAKTVIKMTSSNDHLKPQPFSTKIDYNKINESRRTHALYKKINLKNRDKRKLILKSFCQPSLDAVTVVKRNNRRKSMLEDLKISREMPKVISLINKYKGMEGGLVE